MGQNCWLPIVSAIEGFHCNALGGPGDLHVCVCNRKVTLDCMSSASSIGGSLLCMVNFPVLKVVKVRWGKEQKFCTCHFIFGHILGDMGDLAYKKRLQPHKQMMNQATKLS